MIALAARVDGKRHILIILDTTALLALRHENITLSAESLGLDADLVLCFCPTAALAREIIGQKIPQVDGAIRSAWEQLEAAGQGERRIPIPDPDSA